MWHFYRVVYRNVNSATWWPGISTVTADFSSDILALNVTACSLMLPWIFQLFSRPIHLSIYSGYRVSLLLCSNTVLTILWLNSILKLMHDEWKDTEEYKKIVIIRRKSKCKLEKNSIQFSSIYMLHRKNNEKI